MASDVFGPGMPPGPSLGGDGAQPIEIRHGFQGDAMETIPSLFERDYDSAA